MLKPLSEFNSLPPENFFPIFLSSADFFMINFSEKSFQEYDQSVKQFGSRSGQTFCRALPGSKLFAKVISRQPGDKELNGPQRKKTCLWWFANNKGADQPAHPCSLISAFVIRVLESIISRLVMSEISIF